jgi:hypothetical protein
MAVEMLAVTMGAMVMMVVALEVTVALAAMVAVMAAGEARAESLAKRR